MKYILKAAAGSAALLIAIGALASCSPNEEDDEQVTTTTQTTTTVATTTTQHGSMAASDVIVRSGPGLDYDAIGGITYGEEVTILGREGDWYRIQFGDQVGYISAQYVDVDDAPNASQMVEDLKTTTTQKTAKATTTANAGNETTAAGGTTKADNASDTTTASGKDVTTTTAIISDEIGVPVVESGIPEEVIIDDF